MLIVDRKRISDVSVWAIDGGIDWTTHDEFLAEMQRILDAGEKKVILDFSRLTYISSLSLATLIRLHHRFRKAGAALKFANLHTNVVGILHFAGLDGIFDLYPSIKDALSAFGVRKTP